MRISHLSLLSLLLLPACSGLQDGGGHASHVGESRSDLPPWSSETEAPPVAVAEPAPALPQESPLDAATAEMQRRQAKRAILAEEFTAQGQVAFAEGRFQDAVGLFAQAFDLDRENPGARAGLVKSQQAVGAVTTEDAPPFDPLEHQAVKRSQARLRAESQIAEGDMAMMEGAYDSAIDYYKRAELALRYDPTLGDATLDLATVQAKLEQATEARNRAEAADYAALRSEADQATAAAEAERRNYFNNKVRQLFDHANSSFASGHYDASIESLDQLLELDPRNDAALELRGVALDARHESVSRESDRRFREEWRRTFEELETIAVPPLSSIEHDVTYWRETVLKRQPLDKIAETDTADPVGDRIRALLAETRIEPRFEGQLLEDVVDYLTSYTQVNFVVSPMVIDEVDEDDRTINLVQQQAMSVAKILDLMEVLTRGEVKFVIEDGVVHVLTASEASGGQVLRKYEVRDIVRKVRDYPLKEINLSTSDMIEEIEEEPPDKEATIMTEDDLLETIQETITPDEWDGEISSISMENGLLVVFARPSVQTQVSSLLDDIRRSSDIMVEVKVRFLKAEDSFLEDIGIDFRGLNNADPGLGVSGDVFDDFGQDPGSATSPGNLGTDNEAGYINNFTGTRLEGRMEMLGRTENLYSHSLGSDEGLTGTGGLALEWTWLGDSSLQTILRAVQKSERAEIVTEPKLMVYNMSRANLTLANHVSYVRDFDVEIAQAAAISDPMVAIARDGVFLDVRPTVSQDRRFIQIEVRPTIATLKRPIPFRLTSLGVGSPVTIQLPELSLQKVRTTVPLPDGATLLIGGLKVTESERMDSGVPLLSHLPVLSFFFSRKGNYESKRKLIILLTANIIIPSEWEPRSAPDVL